MANYSRKEMLRNGWQTPENMTDRDKLCKLCLRELKKFQTKGKTYDEAVNIGWQLLLAFLAPGWACLRISRWRKWFLYGALPRWGIMFVGLMIYALVVDNSEAIESSIVMWIVIIFVFIGSPHEYYLIGKWTKEYNKNAI